MCQRWPRLFLLVPTTSDQFFKNGGARRQHFSRPFCDSSFDLTRRCRFKRKLPRSKFPQHHSKAIDVRTLTIRHHSTSSGSYSSGASHASLPTACFVVDCR
eukprot:Lithocolla_globosa_v1_NODE_2514_length_1967_cov_7.751569.p2 type:complete len:101 gc:universal NODE_2514_length_1967_cov_7.751569:479-177(-)